MTEPCVVSRPPTVDLERLKDIHVEQERRLRPLKRQASAAARHDEVHAEWRALRLWLGGERLRTVRGRLDELRRNQGDLKGSLDGWNEERELISGALRELQAASGEVGVALDRDTAAAARLETAAERLHTIALVARERRTGLERSLLDVDERRGDLLRERDDLIRNLESTAAGGAIAAESAERAEIEFRSLEDEERSLADADRLPAEGQVASLRGDLAALDAAAGRDERESADLVRRRGAVATLIDEEAGEEERLRGELAGVAAAVEKAAATRGKARLVAERDRSEASSADDAHRRAETSFAAAAARVEALEAARAGLGDPEARELAATIDGVVGTIAAALDVPVPLSAAVAAALGPWAEAFVARDRGGVAAAASEIKARRPGRRGVRGCGRRWDRAGEGRRRRRGRRCARRSAGTRRRRLAGCCLVGRRRARRGVGAGPVDRGRPSRGAGGHPRGGSHHGGRRCGGLPGGDRAGDDRGGARRRRTRRHRDRSHAEPPYHRESRSGRLSGAVRAGRCGDDGIGAPASGDRRDPRSVGPVPPRASGGVESARHPRPGPGGGGGASRGAARRTTGTPRPARGRGGGSPVGVGRPDAAPRAGGGTPG